MLKHTAAEKLVALPKTHVMQLRSRSNSSQSDFGLVKHLYDVSALNSIFEISNNTLPFAMLRIATQNVMANELQHDQEQQPEFAISSKEELLWAMTTMNAPELIQNYKTFVDQNVYASDAPRYEDALTCFDLLLTECLADSGRPANGRGGFV